MRKLPPLNALRAFEATARLGSAQSASEELQMSHGAIGRHLKQLEAWLGVILFDRSQRSLKLNAAGAGYIHTISSALDLIQQGTINIQNICTSNRLVIAAEHSIATNWLIDKLPEFSKLHPDIEVCLSLEQRLTDLTSANPDIAIKMGTGPWPSMECIPLMTDRLIPVCSPNIIQHGNRFASHKELAKHKLLHVHDPSVQWSLWFKSNNILNIDPTKGPRYSSPDNLLRAAMSGQGVALVSERLAAEDLSEGRLIQPLTGTVELGDYYWLVISQNKLTQQNVQTFIDWITKVNFEAKTEGS